MLELASPPRLKASSTFIGPLAQVGVGLVVFVLLGAHSAATRAQTGGFGLRIQPQLSVTQTITNNLQIATVNPLSDAVTQLTVGANMRSSGGRFQGFLDYGFSSLLHGQHSELNSYQNSLSASFVGDLYEKRATLEVQAGISQTALSAFGAQPSLGSLPSSNSTELRTFSITPSFRGPIGQWFQYQAAFVYFVSNASGTSSGDSKTYSANFRLGPASPSVTSWSIDINSARSDFAASDQTVDARIFGTVRRKIDALDLLVNASVGLELTDLSTFEVSRYRTYGIGASWVPTPRTRLSVQLDERFFGRGHTLGFEHRTALTTWTFSDSRDLSISSNGAAQTGRGATFDLYFALFASIEPDPGKRTDLVNTYLKANGLSPTTGSEVGYLRSGGTIRRSQTAAVAYRGLRGAAVLVIGRSVNVPIDGAAPPSSDFVNSSSITTDTVSLNLSHRLTPTSSATVGFSYFASHGDLANQASSQRLVNLLYSLRLTEKSDASVGLRRASYQTAQSPYNESAVFATFGHRF